jgi:hypothetical protein
MPRAADLGFALLVGACVAGLARPAFAADSSGSGSASNVGGDRLSDPARSGPRPTWFRLFAGASAGIGLRFNNPFRLSRPLGSDAESLSTTAPYSSLGLGAAFGDPFGFQHGPVVRFDSALEGPTQNVLIPSYGLFRRGARFGFAGRFGFPILLAPDRNVGIELAAQGAWYPWAGIGVTGEIIGDLFWGAPTPDNRRPAYPILSGQLGIQVEWERLP